jgi:hypothetical protein
MEHPGANGQWQAVIKPNVTDSRCRVHWWVKVFDPEGHYVSVDHPLEWACSEDAAKKQAERIVALAKQARAVKATPQQVIQL